MSDDDGRISLTDEPPTFEEVFPEMAKETKIEEGELNWKNITLELECGGEIRISALMPEDAKDQIGKEMARLMQSA